MNTTLRSFILGLVVATFALVAAVLVGTIALDAFNVSSLDLHVGPIDLFAFDRGPSGFSAAVGAGAPALVVALAGLNAVAATILHSRAQRL